LHSHHHQHPPNMTRRTMTAMVSDFPIMALLSPSP
jgi:hypothetical protein